jgi:L-lactate dehydrogenase complex protein LldF
MKNQANNFIELAKIAIHHQTVPHAVRNGTLNAFNNRQRVMSAPSVEHGEALRQQAAEIKRRALRDLPDLLEQAEQNLTANGFTVLWAETAEEARQHVLDLTQKHQSRLITKSKSMATEEIALNDALQEAGLDVVETDLGEYILQINDEYPSHIVAPVIHKSKDEIRQIFQDKLDMPYIEDAETMVAFARHKLRESFINADMGISGGNFVISETGSLCLFTNEGNGRMVTTLPPVHVAIVGIEKIIPTLQDYATLAQLLPRSATGQNLTVYSNIINGPCDDGGTEHHYIIFLDNGRSQIYANEKYTEALACIRCGACLNACPVYRSTGGHAYGWVYGGPIGAVITPLLQGIDHATPLPNASSLCGSCKQVCPVDIDLPRMLLDLRHDIVEARQTEFKWDIAIKMWSYLNQSHHLLEWGGKAARIGLKVGVDNLIPNPLGEWKRHRDFPDFAPRSFHQLWRERQKNNKE